MKKPFDDIKNELEELRSILSKTDRTDPEIPLGYFEQLEQEILNKTIGARSEKTKIVYFTWIKYAASIAAIFALVFFGMKLFNQREDQSFEMQFAKMSSAELDNYLTKQIASISADDWNKYISNNINEIEAGLFAETELIDEETLNSRVNSEVNLQILSDRDLNNQNEPLLDKELLDQIDEETIEQLLNDESMYDDFAL